MKKIFLSLSLILLFFANSKTIFADSIITIKNDGNVVNGTKIFNYTNMLPGDMVSETISIENDDDVGRVVNVRCEEVENFKSFGELLEIVISDTGVDIYGGTTGTKKVKDFCDFAAVGNGFSFGIIPENSSKDFSFDVAFNSTAGNDYKNAKNIFNLVFSVNVENIVINEVYYIVDEDHGYDSPKDRGILGFNGNNIVISDNGSSSTNTVNISVRDFCKISQNNDGDLRNSVNIYANTGLNNITNGGSSGIFTGISNITFNLFNLFNLNFGSCNSFKLKQNHEWIEVYNPTDEDISLKNWLIEDNSSKETKIASNKKVKANGFVLISRDSSVWNFWDEADVQKITLGKSIGDGLDNDGDFLILRDSDGLEVDFVSWGNDITRWNPSPVVVTPGGSIERDPLGFDNDFSTDFVDTFPATPGI